MPSVSTTAVFGSRYGFPEVLVGLGAPSPSDCVQKQPCQENLYENQHFDSRHPTIMEEPIYMNEMNDGGSSGYRSSSSPSIHSEENLYENRAVALSLEELSLRGSQVRQLLFSLKKNFS